MSDQTELPQLVFALKAAADVGEVLSILADRSALQALGAHKKDPAVRKAIMLLAALGSTREMDYLSAILTLARLWTVKSLRALVDEYAARVLDRALTHRPEPTQGGDAIALASWLSTRKSTWITEYAADVAVRSADNLEVCQPYVGLLLGRVNLAEGMRLLRDRLPSISSSGPDAPRGGYGHLLAALISAIAKGAMKPGKSLPRALDNLVHRILDESKTLEGDDRSTLGSAAAELVLVILTRYPAMVLTEVPLHLLSVLQRDWFDSSQKAWSAQRKRVLDQIRTTMTLLAVAGEKPLGLALQARSLDNGGAEVEKICRAIEAEYFIGREDVARWLRQGGGDSPAPSAGSKTDTEAIAAVLLRAAEVAAEAGVPPSGGPIESLLAEIRQLGIRKGLSLEGRVGEITNYDPLWQRAAVPVGSGSKVRIVTPGVSRTVDDENFQVVQAIVTPV